MRDIPYGKFRDKGTPVDNISNYTASREVILYVCSVEEMKRRKLFFATSTGMVKVVEGEAFDTSRRTALATKLSEETTRLIAVSETEGYDTVVIQSVNGYFLKFALSEVSEMKKNAIGTHGIKLADDDRAEAAMLLKKGKECVIPYKDRQISLSRLRLSKRGGKGTRH